MKAKLYDQIKTSVKVQADFGNRIIPKGTPGTVVECYENPEVYAVDLAIPNKRLVGGFEYENAILSPDQFAVVNTALNTLNVMIFILPEQYHRLAAGRILVRQDALAILISCRVVHRTLRH